MPYFVQYFVHRSQSTYFITHNTLIASTFSLYDYVIIHRQENSLSRTRVPDEFAIFLATTHSQSSYRETMESYRISTVELVLDIAQQRVPYLFNQNKQII